MPSQEFERQLAEYLEGDLGEAGRAALEHELERDLAADRRFDEAVRFETLLIAAHAPATAGDRILSGVKDKLGVSEAIRGVHHYWAVAAAVVLLALGGWFLWSGLMNGGHQVLSGLVQANGANLQTIPEGTLFRVTDQQPALIRLTDGSTMELAPGSVARIVGRAGFWRQVVRLSQGAGQFRVEKGQGRFRVETPLGEVTVLGTEFSVALRPAEENQTTPIQENPTMKTNVLLALAVAVTVGQVRVDFGGKTYALSAGQTAYAKEGEGQVQREIRGEFNKVIGNKLTILLRGDAGTREETVTVNAETKVLVETDEMEPTPGKEGKQRRKTVEGKLEDLKPSQRISLVLLEGTATRIVVAKARPPEGREGRESRDAVRREGREGENKDGVRRESRRGEGQEGVRREGQKGQESKEGKEGDRRAGMEAKGELAKLEGKQLTLVQRGDAGERELSLTVNDTTPVVVETGEPEAVQGKEGKARSKTVAGKLEDLKPGQRIVVVHNDGVVTKVYVPAAEGPRRQRAGGEGERREERRDADGKAVSGLLSKIEANILTIEVRREGQLETEEKVTLGNATEIFIGGAPGKLEDLETGQRIKATVKPGGLVSRLEVAAPRKGGGEKERGEK